MDMAISSKEVAEFRSLFEDLLDSKLETINYKLDNIEKQTTRTNGRVTELENSYHKLDFKETSHYMSCPNTEKIQKLQDEAVSTKSIKKFLYTAILLTGTIVGIAFSLIKIFVK